MVWSGGAGPIVWKPPPGPDEGPGRAVVYRTLHAQPPRPRRLPRAGDQTPAALERALRALGVAQGSLQAVFENSPDVVLIVDRDRRIAYINRVHPPHALERVLGADACDFVPPGDRDVMAGALQRVFAVGTAEDYEVSAPGPDGRPVVYHSRVTPMVHEGAVTAALITSVDVTERQRSERTQRATYRISEAAHAAHTLQDLFAAIHGTVGELMPARNFYIALHDPVSDTISFPYFVDEHDPTPAPKKPGKGLTEYVLRTGRPLLATPDVALELERRVLEFVSTQVAMAIAHKRAEEELRASELTLKPFLDAIPETALLSRPGRVGEGRASRRGGARHHRAQAGGGGAAPLGGAGPDAGGERAGRHLLPRARRRPHRPQPGVRGDHRLLA